MFYGPLMEVDIQNAVPQPLAQFAMSELKRFHGDVQNDGSYLLFKQPVRIVPMPIYRGLLGSAKRPRAPRGHLFFVVHATESVQRVLGVTLTGGGGAKGTKSRRLCRAVFCSTTSYRNQQPPPPNISPIWRYGKGQGAWLQTQAFAF